MPPDQSGTPTINDRDSAGERVLLRERDTSRPIILLIVAGLVFSVVGGLLWLGQSETAGSVIGEPAGMGQGQPVLELEEIVQERARANLLGRVVSLWRVPVSRVNGDYLFWVGDEADPLAVVLLGERSAMQPELETVIRPGDTLSVLGIIRPVREVTILDEEWAMEDWEWAELARAQIYISALRVDVIPPQSGSPAAR